MKYVRLFALLMRMRQTCCHPFLVLGKGSKKVTPPPTVNAIPNYNRVITRVIGNSRKEKEGKYSVTSYIVINEMKYNVMEVCSSNTTDVILLFYSFYCLILVIVFCMLCYLIRMIIMELSPIRI